MKCNNYAIYIPNEIELYLGDTLISNFANKFKEETTNHDKYYQLTFQVFSDDMITMNKANKASYAISYKRIKKFLDTDEVVESIEKISNLDIVNIELGCEVKGILELTLTFVKFNAL